MLQCSVKRQRVLQLFLLMIATHVGVTIGIRGSHVDTALESNPFLHTQYESADSFGNQVSIQNSYPKGGFQIVDANGTKLSYVVFFTNIVNEGHDSIEYSIRFPTTPIVIPQSPNIQFSLSIPNIERQTEDETKTDYGLLDIQQGVLSGAYLNRTLSVRLAPGDTGSFYVLALSEKGMQEPVRAGLQPENNELKYTINGATFTVGAFKRYRHTH